MASETVSPDTQNTDREVYLQDLTQEVVGFNLSGPGAAARLYDAGLTLQEAQHVLNAVGYQAYADSGNNRISVSVERFEKGTLTPVHYSSRLVSFNPEDERPRWMTEL